MTLLLLTALVVSGVSSFPEHQVRGATFPEHLVGTTDAVAALLERVLPGSSAHFALSLAPTCPGVPQGQACFTLADSADGAQTVVTGTTASELTGGLGVYLREHCGMTFGWPRGGGSHVFTPSPWPRVGAPVSTSRSAAYSHVITTNVTQRLLREEERSY